MSVTRMFQVLVLVSGVTLASCGDDSGGGDGASTACVVGMQSTPGMAGDPCRQTGTDCAAVGGSAVSMCQPTMTWNPACTCLPAGASLTCNNNVLDVGEQCDGVNLNGQSCASMGMGTGTLNCDRVSCMYDTSMCAPGAPVGGAGG